MSDSFQSLLLVQEHDTTADQLRHRRRSLPELVQLRGLEDRLSALEATAGEAKGETDEIARRQGLLEHELAGLQARVDELKGRLYSGEVTVPRELQAMQAELGLLTDRRSAVEDLVLEAMEEAEASARRGEELAAVRADLDAEGARLRAAIAEAQAGIDADLVAIVEERRVGAATLPGDLARLYEQLRAKLGGIGAAPLVAGRCGGCHLTLSASERDRIRHQPPDALLRCEHCGRVLVRPPG
ncbi:MAG: zinc ribbon domain-containing protein [Acidimicrobiales bacterium]